MDTKNREMKDNSKSFSYSKLQLIITGSIFIACVVFVITLYLTGKISSVYDTAAIVSLISVSGAIFGSNLCWYSKKSASENHYKLRMSLFADSARVRLEYNEHMMKLMKKYQLRQEDIDRIDITGDADEMMQASLDSTVNDLNVTQDDADSVNTVESFSL